MPRSGRVSITRVPPLQGAIGGSSLSLLRGYPGLGISASPRLQTSISGSLGVSGMERKKGPSLEGRKLREHVQRAGKVVLDIALWSKQCDTPRTEDPTATWTAGAPITFSRIEEDEKVSSNDSKTDVRTPVTPSFTNTATSSSTVSGNPPFLGVEITVDRWSGTDGLKVLKVTQDSPAALGGVRAGDYIRRVNGVQLITKRDLKNTLLSACPTTPGAGFPSLYLDVFRPGHALLRLHVTPTPKPADIPLSSKHGKYASSRLSGSAAGGTRRRHHSYMGRSSRGYPTSP